MFTFVSLTLALAVGSAIASPIPQAQDPTETDSTASPTVVIDPMPTAPVCAHTYTAVAGDTCQSIGDKYQVSANQIHEANPYFNCDDVWAWTPVCIPEGGVAPTDTTPPPSATCTTTYTSVPGDTCASIGAEYGLSAEDIHNANTFLTCDNIWEWTPVCIPAGGVTPPPPASTCASTYTSEANDTCESIESKFQLPAGSVKQFNGYVTCDNIWVYTPICLPAGPTYTATLPTLSVPAATETSDPTETPAPTDTLTI